MTTIALVLSLRLADDLRYLALGLIILAIGAIYASSSLKKINRLKEFKREQPGGWMRFGGGASLYGGLIKESTFDVISIDNVILFTKKTLIV